MTEWTTIDFGAVEISDSRGNRLLRYRIRDVRGTSEQRLYLYAHEATAAQIQWALQPFGCDPLQLTDEQRREWTHRFRLDGPADQDVISFLDMMEEVLTLNVPSEIDAALALDFHKDPESHEDPMHWENTAAGELVSRGKYGGFAKEGRELASQLASVIARHPVYRAADAIVMVPSSRNKFGERLAAAVAAECGKTLIRTRAAHATRPEAKNADDESRPDLTNEFTVPTEEASGRVVILVDDVYKTGGTIRAVSGAARTAGAAAVLGLVGTRTLRKGGT